MNHLFLTGFMGAGKSAVGKRLAARLGLPFVDLDREIERREGMPIPEIFRTRHEAGFRDAEHATLEALVERGPAVVATGGGAVLRHDNQALLRRHGRVVYLSVTPEEAMARLGDTKDRPLLAGGGIETARSILAARLPVYAATADVVVATDGLTPDQVVDSVLRVLAAPADHEVIHVHEPGGSGYDVLVGAGLLGRVGELIAERLSAPMCALVSDETVWALLGSRVQESLEAAGIRSTPFVVPAGEESKSWEQAGLLLRAFSEAGLDRTSAVVGLGGGVIGDLAGFCAASYMRGITLVHVPTTLLAQVDSAIGGKTGVDLPSGKNLVGAFWPPRLVVSDTDVLATLPDAEWTNGLVELVKGALLEGGPTLERVERNIERLVGREPDAVVRGVRDAAAFKAGVVSADFREADARESLNLGHTLGHALELLVGYGVLPHGLAVAEGMRFAARLAEELVGASPELTGRTYAIMESVGAGEQRCADAIAAAGDRVTPALLLAAMKADKKARDGIVRFVLLEKPGRWRALPVADEVLMESLDTWTQERRGA